MWRVRWEEVKGRRGWTDGAGICSAVGVELTGSVGSPRVRPNRDGHVYFSLFFLFINICVLCIGHLNWSMDGLFFKIVFGFFNGLTNLVILFDVSD
jgi:hypothetical protein